MSASSTNSFAAFGSWADRYLSGDASANVHQGEALAWKRREALRELIARDPKAALDQAVPFELRQRLPANVTRHFEERIDATGDLAVLVATDFNSGKSTTLRQALIEGRKFDAYVYGRRTSQRSQRNIALHGIALGDRMAVLSESARQLSAAEAAAMEQAAGQTPEAICGVSQQPVAVAAEPVVAAVGKKVRRFCAAAHFHLVANRTFDLAASSDPDLVGDLSVIDAAWTHGSKTVLYMRVNFPDDLTEPLTEARAAATMDEVNRFYVKGSYGATALTTTFTPLVTLPRPKPWYSTAGPGALLDDARDACRRAGYDTDRFDLDIVAHTSVPNFDWGGLGYVGWKGTWLQSHGVKVTAHELGHNYGLWHANYWSTTNASAIGAGEHLEYGNIFDTMGSGESDFSALFKVQLGWLPRTAVADIATNGTYRVYPFDAPTRTAGRAYAARVTRDGLRDYWLSLRQEFRNNRWNRNGFLLDWTEWYPETTGSHLLDTTQGTPSGNEGREDAALVIGRTFSDPVADIHFTPTGRSSNGTNDYLDLHVEFGPFPDNRPPKLKLEMDPTNAAPGELVHFHADASDPDGDELAYAWSFSDHDFSTNNLPWIAKRWTSAGHRVVRCVVSDRKGGVASANLVVPIGAANGIQINGRIMDLAGRPLEGVRVDNRGTNYATYVGGHTDSDGRFVITGVVEPLELTAFKPTYGLTNTPDWFNPIDASADVTNAHFVAFPLGTVSIAFATNAVAENNPAVSDLVLTRTGDTNVDLAVRIALSGTATLLSDYRLSPELTNDFNTVVIPVGETNLFIPFQTINDSQVEGLETVAVTLLEDAAYELTLAHEVLIDLVDDENLPRTEVTVAASNETLAENGMDVGRFIFRRTGSTAAELVVNYIASGTATAGTDYDPLLGVVLFPVGSSTAEVLMNVIDDRRVEADETVIVTVQPAATHTAGPAATITLLDDDFLTVTVTATDDTLAEPGQTGGFTVTREGDLSGDLRVHYTVTGSATADVDYEYPSGQVVIPAGEASARISITALNDTSVEGDESVVVTLTGDMAYSVGLPASALLRIRDDERAEVFVAAIDEEASEPGEDIGGFVVGRSGGTAGPLLVRIAVSGSAVNGVDFVPIDSEVLIPDGASSVSLDVIPFDDLHAEYDEQAVLTVLPSPDYTIAPGTSAEVTIKDDDGGVPAVGFAQAASFAPESLSPGIVVSLSATSSSPVTVEYQIFGGTAPAGDYQLAASPLTFEPGEWSKSIPLRITSNTVAQANRTVRLVLFNPTGATLDGLKIHTYTILDDDAAGVTVAATVATASEATGAPGNFRLTRTGNTASNVTVHFQITGTASAPTDYAPLGQSVVIPAGAATVDLPVTPVNDGTQEPAETVVLTLTSVDGGTVNSPRTASVVISDNNTDSRPEVLVSSVEQPHAVEGGGSAQFRFVRTGSTAADLVVEFTVTGLATPGLDYAALPVQIVIPAGNDTATLDVVPVNDTLIEGEETVVLSLLVNDRYHASFPSAATVIVQDNDQSVRVDASDFIAAEPGTNRGEFTFTRIGTTNSDVVVNYTVAGTAGNGVDYATLPGALVIPAGSLSATLAVEALDDLLVEGPEKMTLTLGTGPGYTLGAVTSGTITIEDDEPMLTLIAAVPTTVEGSPDPAVLRVIRTGDPKYNFVAKLRLGGSAIQGVDYPMQVTNLVFSCSVTSIDLHIFATNELVIEGVENVTAVLLPDPAYTILSPSNAVVTIEDAGDNQAPQIAFVTPTAPTVFLPGTNGNLILETLVTDTNPETVPTLLWTKTSGPDEFTFGPTDTNNTTASFTNSGIYVLRLTTDDGLLTNYSEITVVVGAVQLLGSNLVHWTFNDGTGDIAADASGSGRSGALGGGPVWNSEGANGGSLEFDGADDSVQTTNGFLNGLDAFTLSFWIRAAETNSDRGILTADASGADETFAFQTRTLASCSSSTNVFEATIPTTDGLLRYTSSSGVGTTQWQHLVLTWTNGSPARLYVDGKLDRPMESTLAWTGTITNAPDFILGRGPASSPAPWLGGIDELRVFPRALDEGEVLALAELPPDNYAPLVLAGDDTTNLLINPFVLSGVVTDDGNPVPPALTTHQWAFVSGPAEIQPPDPTALTNTIQFTVAGDYIFRLIADDGQVRPYDDILLTIIEPVQVDVFASDAEAAELGPDTGEFTFTRQGDLEGELTLFLMLTGTASNKVDFPEIPDVVHFGAGTGSVTMAISPFLDHRTEGDETVTFVIQSNLNYTIGSGEATVTLKDSPFGQWTVDRFTLEELTDPVLSGEGADFDQDRLVNLAEYASNREPKTPDTNKPVALTIETNSATGLGHLVVSFPRRLEPTDVTTELAVSHDLVTWNTDATYIEQLDAIDDGNMLTETVRARVVVPLSLNTNHFINVRVRLRTTGP